TDPRARLVRSENVFQDNRRAASLRGLHRPRMERLRAEVRELCRFVVRKRGEGKRFRNNLRVRAHETADILPNLNRWQLEGVRNHGGTVIGSAAAERRRLAFSGAAEESRDHAHMARQGLAPEERRKPKEGACPTAPSGALAGLRPDAEMLATELFDVRVALLLLPRLRQNRDEGVRHA